MGAGTQSETMHERMDESRLRYWLLMNGDRWLIASGLTLGLFVVLVAVGAVAPSAFRTVMGSTNQVGITFQALIASLITGVTLVVTIGQLVLSQEFGSLDKQRDRMTGAVEFRHDLRDSLGAVGPPDPPTFLGWLVDLSKDRAEALDDALESNDNEELREQVTRFVDDLVENAEGVGDRLTDTEFGEFDLLRAAMDYNYSWKIYGAQWLRTEYRDELTDDERTSFEALLDVLTLFGPTREHFKSLYFQWELIRLLRAVLATALPALAVATATLLFLAPTSFPGSVFGVATIIWVVSAAAALSVVPFFVLTSIVLRIATVAKRTSAIGPFILHESDRGDDIDLTEE
ncbi:hypothetical protein [Halococcus sp. IIIV-5B]|uniref:hypothetical protein n=1 Tax=Halococcus sp. IIIV-5B TaxID=2321230 RepID=UPI000E753AB4|nr:hypothetical protein [Halococcus sp. IIIV-5B]RJS98849.1 hypothetical protein D3261_16505 [Halococcus sp. IIIV-5B]